MFFWFIHGVPYENGLKHVSGRRRAGHFKTMRYGKWTRWCTAGMLVLLAGCTAEEWAQFSKEMEENQRAAAERRATYHNISVQCSDWDMRGTATAGLSAKGFRVMYPGGGGLRGCRCRQQNGGRTYPDPQGPLFCLYSGA